MFCSLATRFYDSVNGHIDSKGKERKTLSGSLGPDAQSWLSNQKKRQEQRRPSPAAAGGIVQSIPLQSQLLPETRVKQLKGNLNLAGGPRIPPKVLTHSPPSIRKVPKSAFSIPTAPTKKPEPRDYEDPAEEELEYENTSSARNQ